MSAGVRQAVSSSPSPSEGHWGQMKIHHRLDYCCLDHKATSGPALPQLLQLPGNAGCN